MSSHPEEKLPKVMDTSIKVALIGAVATLAAAVITTTVTWRQQPAPTPKPVPPAPAPDGGQQQPPAPPVKPPQLTLDRILDILQNHCQRATYGAVAGALGCEPQSLFKGYPRTSRTAWVVNKDTGLPTGQKQPELPPCFLKNAHVITTKEELLRWIEEKK